MIQGRNRLQPLQGRTQPFDGRLSLGYPDKREFPREISHRPTKVPPFVQQYQIIPSYQRRTLPDGQLAPAFDVLATLWLLDSTMAVANQFIPRESVFFSDTHRRVLVFTLRPIFFLRPLAEIVRTVGSLFFLVWTQLEISLSQPIDEIHGGSPSA
jgi:hypothetical protein